MTRSNEDSYVPRRSRILRHRRGLPYLTHTPKVELWSRSLHSRFEDGLVGRSPRDEQVLACSRDLGIVCDNGDGQVGSTT